MKEWKIIKDWVTPSGLRACCIINYKGTINGYVEVQNLPNIMGQLTMSTQ